MAEAIRGADVLVQALQPLLADDVDDGRSHQQVEGLERELIAKALAAEDGVQYRAAERLGISERTLRYKLEKYRMR